MKVFSITINASPRYPIKETFQVSATNWPAAISRAVREYFKKHKHMRTKQCYVSAFYLSQKLKQEEGASDE